MLKACCNRVESNLNSVWLKLPLNNFLCTGVLNGVEAVLAVRLSIIEHAQAPMRRKYGRESLVFCSLSVAIKVFSLHRWRVWTIFPTYVQLYSKIAVNENIIEYNERSYILKSFHSPLTRYNLNPPWPIFHWAGLTARSVKHAQCNRTVMSSNHVQPVHFQGWFFRLLTYNSYDVISESVLSSAF